MRRFLPFNVSPRIPEELGFLETLANNLWWSWNQDAVRLFQRISPRLFKEVNANPVSMLNRVDQQRFELLAADNGFIGQLQHVRERFNREVMQSKHWEQFGEPFKCIGYFSLEFGLNENLRLYSGGLGILAGDHLKSASDLDLPLVGVGLLYREGYFEQTINLDGQQQEGYPENDLHVMPVTRVNLPNGNPLQVSVPLPEGRLTASVWHLDVGRVRLFLLDTNTSSNPPELRGVTGRLYGGDRLNRLRQEILLGIGGYRALDAMGYTVAVSHMNEGHAAFLSLSRLDHLRREYDLELDVAREIIRRTSVFTTHTPVPAGNETFDLDLLKPHLEVIEKKMHIPVEQVVSWGQVPDANNGHELSMTVLGFNTSGFNNGVSKLHGDVERNMWAHLWPDVPEDEIPIRHITNGVHVSTWQSAENAELCDRYLGPEWQLRVGAQKLLHRIEQIPDEEIWRAHELSRARLVRSAREHVERRMRARNAPRAEIAAARSILDPDALTIGFARRFATYKRANLILKDIERLARILNDRERPVQLIFAGKAHPADEEGKALITEVLRFARREDLRHGIVFLDDYDMHLARYLVRGVDVWLNTPRRPHEASGTSGMKACLNGGLHFSVLDGWWCEGYDKTCGWAIGNGEEYRDEHFQDTVESQALYNTLENEVVPIFYDRPGGDLPTQWCAMMKASMRMALLRFSSHRMVNEYNERIYEDAYTQFDQLLSDEAALAKRHVAHHGKLREAWSDIRIDIPSTETSIAELHVGDSFTASTRVSLGVLKPEDVSVELYFGPLDPNGLVIRSHAKPMGMAEELGAGDYIYRQTIECSITGRFGFTARVRPAGTEWNGIMPGYIRWAEDKKEPHDR